MMINFCLCQKYCSTVHAAMNRCVAPHFESGRNNLEVIGMGDIVVKVRDVNELFI